MTELEKVSKARQGLTPEQLVFAEWLALPSTDRIPRQQQDLAIQLKVAESTLCQWKKIPELWQVRDEILGTKGREMVAEAIAVQRSLLHSPNTRVAADIAKQIIDMHYEPLKHKDILTTIKDLWDKYHKDG